MYGKESKERNNTKKSKSFIKLDNPYKIVAFVFTIYYGIKEHIRLDISNFPIIWMRIAFPIFIISLSYIMACALGEFASSIVEKKK